ncbi:MAG: DUF3467 domain-containing protein [Bacteroidota bacterium]
MEEKKQKRQLNIELPEEVAEGVYSNMAMINHSPTEFVMDFIRMMPNMPKAKVKSRVILTPQHAKSLLKVLNENIKRYEGTYGPIKEAKPPSFPMNFNTPKAQA